MMLPYYTKRFRKDIAVEDFACECSFLDYHSFYHLIYECPRFTRARQIAAHHADWQKMDPQELSYSGWTPRAAP
jgi:hypothetical protein